MYLKWYLVYPDSLPLSQNEVNEAQQFLCEEISTGRLGLSGGVGFVVQHRTAAYLILYVCSWRNNNEVWETLYHNPLTSGAGYQLFKRADTSPTFCVWVLPVVSYEQQAWSRYLKSGRDEAARVVYLRDQLEGSVW